MTNPRPLSPAAQAVLDAYWNYPWDPQRQHEDRGSIAAALRAAAEHIDDASDGLECQDILRQIAAELAQHS